MDDDMTASASPPAKTLGSYELICKLSESAVGTLWAATPDSAEDPEATVMIRIVDPDPSVDSATLRKLASVAEDAKVLEHDNVLTMVELIKDQGKLGLVTEFVEGESLGAMLRVASVRRAPIPAAVGLRIALDLLQGLSFVHAEASSLEEAGDYVRGGIAPGSVLVGADGRARLLEIGVAGLAARTEPYNRDPKRVAYMSPEALESEDDIDERSDLFTVGVFLWELLQNKRLFGGLSYAAVSKKLKEQKIPRADDGRAKGAEEVSKGLADVVARAVARKPEDRFKTAEAMAEAIRATGDDIADHEQVAQSVDKLAGRTITSNRSTIHRAVTGVSLRPPAPGKSDQGQSSPVKKVTVPKAPAPPKDLGKPPAKKKDDDKDGPPESAMSFSKPLLPKSKPALGVPPKKNKDKKKPPKPPRKPAEEEIDESLELEPYTSLPPEAPDKDSEPEGDDADEPKKKPPVKAGGGERDADEGLADDDDEDEGLADDEDEGVGDNEPTAVYVPDEDDEDVPVDEDDEGDTEEADVESDEPPAAAARGGKSRKDSAPLAAALREATLDSAEDEAAEQQKRRRVMLAMAAVVIVIVAVGWGMTRSGDGGADTTAAPGAAPTMPQRRAARTAEPSPAATPAPSETEEPAASGTPEVPSRPGTMPVATAPPPAATPAPAPPPTEPAPKPTAPPAAPTPPPKPTTPPAAPTPPPKPPEPDRFLPGDL
jgi:serine/threonine-protein kinase